MVSEESPPEEKKKKGKKRPSDFEIIRTILQRSHERKLPFLMKHLGEDSDLLFLCSDQEVMGSGDTAKPGFKFGSPETAIALFKWTNDEIKNASEVVLSKLVGIDNDHCTPVILNIREQLSLLAKSKGEELGVEAKTNGMGTWWYTRPSEKGEDPTVYLSKGIDSLFHTRQVKAWCDRYRHLLDAEDPRYLFYTYTHPAGNTGEILTLSPPDPTHPMGVLYPHGFRSMVTRGKDVILDKFLVDLPFPILKQELIVFPIEVGTAQIAHRIIAEGWSMILLRPNAVVFPTAHIPLPDKGLHLL